MHIEIQVALNFVISYLYNKLPRRRVNIFGEELERALKHKFQGHWYPERPFKGSAFRCLKTGEPTDAVLERAAQESGVPITDILENLPNELSVWVDPGEVSYRIGEKGSVKILYSENSDNHEDAKSADCEVNKTFSAESECFRPIDVINTSISNLSLSPKSSPNAGSSPLSASSNSPIHKSSPNTVTTSIFNSGSFLQRSQAPLTFTTATFAQTKFGSTKLKTNSKRSNNSSYRMSPTEFSNYIKQRAMQQQMHQGHGQSPTCPPQHGCHYGAIGPISPSRSLSPNSLMALSSETFYYPNMSMGMFSQFNGHPQNHFDTHFHAPTDSTNSSTLGATHTTITNSGNSKTNNYLDPFYGSSTVQNVQHQQQIQPSQLGLINSAHLHQQQHKRINISGTNESIVSNSKENIPILINNATTINNAPATITVTITNDSSPEMVSCSTILTASSSEISTNTTSTNSDANGTTVDVSFESKNAAVKINQNIEASPSSSTVNTNNNKLIEGLNLLYSNGSYQQLLVAN